jgi:hypothetical protein
MPQFSFNFFDFSCDVSLYFNSVMHSRCYYVIAFGSKAIFLGF